MTGTIPTFPATKWWHPEGDRIVCDLCPRECRLGEGQRGFCFVRKNEGGEMQLTTYGKSTGFCIDPIEKKPLNHFLPGTPVLSFGTAGCNLGCKFCQNWDISKSRELEALQSDASPSGIAQAALRHGARSVAFTYNDPVIFLEYARDTALACLDVGIEPVVVTAGYVNPLARADLFGPMRAANVDLKAFTEEFYNKITAGHLAPVLDTLRYLVHETEVWTEVTTLLIPGLNDSDDELHQMCAWIAANLGPQVSLHFSAFHPDHKMRDVAATPAQTLSRARAIGLQEGLHYVYTGNVHDAEGDTTFCPGCRAPVIERDWYQLLSYRIVDGGCAACGQPIAGHFEAQPGTWGRRRLPITP